MGKPNFIKRILKLREFEYWPFGVFYIPLYFYGFYLAFKSKSLMYFSATNPSMKYGGVMGESKISVLNKIDKKYLPNTLFFTRGTSLRKILYQMQSKGLLFPVIAKPNMGERGKAVEKLRDKEALKLYLEKYAYQDFILQEFINTPLELGILYYRYPNNEKGDISSIVLKEFLTVEGNGESTLKQLIEKSPRAQKRKQYLFEKFENQLQIILANGQKMNLEPIGNHSRGTKFINGNHLINEQLKNTFDNVTRHIEGYYYGRFDIKVSSLEDLYAGKGIRILELNGVSSEPAHIYDPNMKLLQAYKDLLKHAAIIQKISYQNHKNGVPYDALRPFLIDLIHFIFPSKVEEAQNETAQIPNMG